MSYSIMFWTTDGEEYEYTGYNTREEAEEKMDAVLASNPERYTQACVSKE